MDGSTVQSYTVHLLGGIIFGILLAAAIQKFDTAIKTKKKVTPMKSAVKKRADVDIETLDDGKAS